MLVHYPEIADNTGDVSGLATSARPGVPLLMELLENLCREPCTNTAVLLERWRGRPDVEHLAKLATLECHIPDASGAARELHGALAQLIEEGANRRRDQLLRKHAQDGLTDLERAELQALLRSRDSPNDGQEFR